MEKIQTTEILDERVKKFVIEYQCSGCVVGSDAECYEKGENLECEKHVAGTTIFPVVGRIFLGLPKGFCRLGPYDDMKVQIVNSLDEAHVFDFLNVPVWKYLDEHGNTLVRGLSPRVNVPFIRVFLEDCMDRIKCHQLTEEDLDGMD